MNEFLTEAMRELKELKAEGVPSVEEITNAEGGSIWSGKLAGGGKWKLLKENDESYTTNTSSEEG